MYLVTISPATKCRSSKVADRIETLNRDLAKFWKAAYAYEWSKPWTTGYPTHRTKRN
jgi:hypothetical protein